MEHKGRSRAYDVQNGDADQHAGHGHILGGQGRGDRGRSGLTPPGGHFVEAKDGEQSGHADPRQTEARDQHAEHDAVHHLDQLCTHRETN